MFKNMIDTPPFQPECFFTKKENFDKIKLRGIYFFPNPFTSLTDFILKFKIYELFNLMPPLFLFFP